MPISWCECHIIDIAEVINGASFRSIDFLTKHTAGPEDLPVFKMGNIMPGGGIKQGKEDYIPRDIALKGKKQITRPGDILMSMTDMKATMNLLGYSGQITDEVFAVNQRVGIVRPNNKKVNPRYLYYYLNSPKFINEIRKTSHSGVQVNLSSKAIKRASVWLPRRHTQDAIAEILGSLDDKIELNHRMNETLEAIAQAIFKSWFIDLDPVHAKAAGRDPGLPKEIAGMFSDSFVDMEFGSIPKGWLCSQLQDVIDLNPKRSLRNGEVAPYVDMASMPKQGHSPDSVVEKAFSSGMRFTNGDTLLARITPCLENGKTAYIDFLKKGQVGWGSTEYIVMRPKPPLPGEFAYCLARSNSFREFAIKCMTGTSGRQRVSVDSLSQYRIAIPPVRTTEMFGSSVRLLFSRANIAMQESQTLTTLRNVLLPKLISGEIE